MRRLLVVVSVLLWLGGCARCGKSSASAKAELAHLLPRNAEAILIVPHVGRLGERVSVLENLKIANVLAQLQGMPTAKELVGAISAQIGVDIRSREELKRAGFDPGRGMAMVVLPDQQGYSVIAIDDADKFRAMAERLSRDRLGATKTETQSETQGDQAVEVTRFVGPRGVVAAMAIRGGFAFLAAEPVASRLVAISAIAPGTSLAEEPGYARALERLPKDRELLAYLPPASRLASQYRLGGAAISGKLADDDVTFVIDVPWPNNREGLLALEKKDAKSAYPVLPEDAFALARFAGDPVALDTIWPHLVGIRFADRVREAGLDVRGELLSALEPGAVLSLSLSPMINFQTGLPTDPRRSNPFKTAHLVAAAKVKDASKLGGVLEKLPAVAPKIGAKVTPSDRDGQKVYLTEYSQGQGLHFALVGDTLVAASPEQRLTAAVAQAKTPMGEGPLTTLRAPLEKNAITFVVDLHKLSEQVRALPSSAWGIGGFAIKATTVRWLDATDDLEAITGALSAKDGAVQAELHLRIAKK